MARIVAVDPQGPNLLAQGTQQPNQTQSRVQDTTIQSLSQQVQSLNESQRILSETASTVSQSNLTVAKSKDAQAGQRGGLGGLLDLGVQLGSRTLDIQKGIKETQLKRELAEQKQRQAEREARGEQQAISLNDSLSRLVTDQTKRGTIITREGMDAIFNDPDFQDIDPGKKLEIQNRYLNKIESTDNELLKAARDLAKESDDAKIASVEANLLLTDGSLLVQLERTRSEVEQQELIQIGRQNAIKQYQDAGLTGIALSNAVSSWTMRLAQSGLVSSATIESIQVLDDEYRQYSNEVKLIDDMDIPWEEKQDKLNQLKIRFPEASKFEAPTSEGAIQAQISSQQAIAALRQLAQEDYEFNNQGLIAEDAVITIQAVELLTDPSLITKYESVNTGDNKRTIEQYKLLQKLQTELTDPSRKVTESKLNSDVNITRAQLAQIEMYRGNPEAYLRDKKAGVTSISAIDEAAYERAASAYQSAIEQQQAYGQDVGQKLAQLQSMGLVFNPATGRIGLSEGLSQDFAAIQSKALEMGDSPPPDSGGGSSQMNPPTGPLKVSGKTPEGLVGGGTFGGLGVPGFNPAGGNAQPSQPSTAPGANNAGPRGNIKIVNAVDTVHTGHWDHSHNPGTHKFDLTLEEGGKTRTAIPSPVTGEVTDVYYQDGPKGGYGHSISVYDPATGLSYFFAHLADKPFFKPGDRVHAGQGIGIQGSTGTSSTGNPMDDHVHLEVWKGRTPFVDAVPVAHRETADKVAKEYIERARTGNWPTPNTRGLGAPPDGNRSRTLRSSTAPVYRVDATPIPPGGFAIGGGAYMLNGEVIYPGSIQVRGAKVNLKPTTVNSKVTSQNPIMVSNTSINRKDYPPKNDPGANYGYTVLADDHAFRAALVGTADRLDIPAQWLADVIAHESNFDPSIPNRQGAIGLIQFFPGGGLAEVANSMGVSQSAAKQRLAGMTRAQQMRWVEFYLKKQLSYAGRTKFESVGDLAASVFGGVTMLSKPESERQNMGDGAITYREYLNRLGRNVGRKYGTNRGGKPTHTKKVAGCSVCEGMMRSSGTILPHQAV